MSPPQQLRQQTSNCSLLLIYRPRKDERLSWPSWLTYSGWFTHISGHPSATGRAQDSESSPAKDRCSTAGPRNQLQGVASNGQIPITIGTYHDLTIQLDASRSNLERCDLTWDLIGNICDRIWKGFELRHVALLYRHAEHDRVNKLSNHFCLGCSLMPKLHCTSGVIDITVTVQSMSCVMIPKTEWIKYR